MLHHFVIVYTNFVSFSDYKLTNGLKDIAYEIKLRKMCGDDGGNTSMKNVSAVANEVELKFDFPIQTSEDLNYFLDSLNDISYRDVMVCNNSMA